MHTLYHGYLWFVFPAGIPHFSPWQNPDFLLRNLALQCFLVWRVGGLDPGRSFFCACWSQWSRDGCRTELMGCKDSGQWFAIVGWKQPCTTCEWIGVAMFQQSFIYTISSGPGWTLRLYTVGRFLNYTLTRGAVWKETSILGLNEEVSWMPGTHGSPRWRSGVEVRLRLVGQSWELHRKTSSWSCWVWEPRFQPCLSLDLTAGFPKLR